MTQTALTLRERLTAARLAVGMTQTEAAKAKALNKPQSWLSKIETGETQRPRFVHIVQLARLYSPVGWTTLLKHFAEAV